MLRFLRMGFLKPFVLGKVELRRSVLALVSRVCSGPYSQVTSHSLSLKGS